ncbi:MAG: hypothetical protein ABI425_05365 [Patescibacteria group bacterium]
MFITEAQVEKYQMLYKARFGKEISYEDAYEKGLSLVRLMQIIYKPMTKVQYQQVMERKKQLELL